MFTNDLAEFKNMLVLASAICILIYILNYKEYSYLHI